MAQYLITGGSGSFGNAYVEHLLSLTEASRICIYSRDEYKQSLMRDRFENNEKLRFFIGDVRDKERLVTAMTGIDVVVHAAALKRIEVGAYDPYEMVKTNVIGASNVIHAAYEAKVKKVIALSTDKAYQPISPYGQSKALAESLFLAANNFYGAHGPRYAVTRYGNVTGSTGSVVPKWREILKTKSHVPVTSIECTRFHMTMDQAVKLVSSTINKMQGGELVIPHDLPAYRLGDLAQAMGASAIINGLPTWEKSHECMSEGNCSNSARRLTIEEIRKIIEVLK